MPSRLKLVACSFTVLLTLVNVLLVQAEDEESPMVTLAQGSLKGKVMTSTFKGKKFSSFQGIPYAKPPVGELRFRAPLPAGCWEGVRDATSEGMVCPQNDFFKKKIVGSEDCLFVNVYTPQLPDGSSPLKDVMVYVPGGGFTVGSGDTDAYGPNFFMDEDIILVTLNYRIGALGFLSTEDAASPGNYGLKDQVQALKWVKENIVAFGGNPDSVTIFGESAGGASVHFLVLSPMAKGLFHRAIAQSGSALSSWAVYNSKEQAFKQGQLVNCTSQDSQELIECLRSVETEDFIKSMDGFLEYGSGWNFPFFPIVEREVGKDEPAFLPESPQEIVRKGEYNKVPLIAGITAQEGIILIPPYLQKPPLLKEHLENFDRVAPVSFFYERNTTKSEEITRRIKEFYFGADGLKNKVTDQTLPQFIDLATDRLFAWGLDRLVKEHVATSSTPVYVYDFTHDGRFGFFHLLFGDKLRGAAHADDVAYMFSSTILHNDFKTSDPDYKFVQWFVNMWTDFAKTGNPTPLKNDLINVTWEPATINDNRFLEIGSELRMCRDLLKNRMAFWDKMEEFINSDTD